MTTNIATAPAIQTTSTDEKQPSICGFTARRLAADLLEQYIGKDVFALHIVLIRIVDAGLLHSVPYLHRAVDELREQAGEAHEELAKTFPVASSQRLSHLRVDFGCEIHVCRQEHFWQQRGGESLVKAEKMFRAIHALHARALYLLREIDSELDDGFAERNYTLPVLAANPYESVF